MIHKLIHTKKSDKKKSRSSFKSYSNTKITTTIIIIAKNSNIRDYATINELTVLSNLESHNAELIKEGKSKEERFELLSEIANYQLEILNNAEKIKLLNDK